MIGFEDGLSVAVITGASGTFCAGMDLKRFQLGEVASIPVYGFGGVTLRPPAKPLIAAVEGHAVGGGFELALACDLIVASEAAVFGLPEVKRGLVARAGGLMRLADRLPLNIAKFLVLTGDYVSARLLAEHGLVNEICPPGEALITAQRLAGKIHANAPLAVQASKRVITERTSWPASDAWERQAAIVDPLFDSADAREGALAFTERRPPVWSGR